MAFLFDRAIILKSDYVYNRRYLHSSPKGMISGFEASGPNPGSACVRNTRYKARPQSDACGKKNLHSYYVCYYGVGLCLVPTIIVALQITVPTTSWLESYFGHRRSEAGDMGRGPITPSN